MKKKGLWIIVAVIVILAGYLYYTKSKSADSISSENGQTRSGENSQNDVSAGASDTETAPSSATVK